MSYNWENVKKAQNQINNDPQLNRDQKLDRLFYIMLSNDENNWI